MLLYNAFLIFLSLLIFSNVRGDDNILGMAPLSEDDKTPNYFIQLKEEGTQERDNFITLDVLPAPGNKFDNEQTCNFKVVGTKITDKIMIKFEAIEELEEDDDDLEKEVQNFVLDHLFVKTYEFDDLQKSIFVKKNADGTKTLVFVDEHQKCYQRTYTIHKLQFTVTVQRSKVESIACPEKISMKLKAPKGKPVVQEFTPEGLALETLYLQKGYGERELKDTDFSFTNAQDFKLLCQNEGTNGDEIATVFYKRTPLEIIKLRPNTCQENLVKIVPQVAKTGKTDNEETHIMIAYGGAFGKRSYVIYKEDHPSYTKVNILRKKYTENL